MANPAPAAVVPAGNVAPAVPAAPVVPAASPVPASVATPARPAGAAPVVPSQPESMVPARALHEERERRQALQNELEGLRRGPAPQQQPQIQPQPGYQPIAGVDPRQELEQLWDKDPRKAVQVEIMYAMDWRDRVENNLNLQADNLAGKYGDFNNYRSQSLSYVRTLPAHQRAAPGLLESAYFMMRGQGADQLIAQREQEWLAKYQRGEITAQTLQQPAGGGYSAPAPVSGTVLTQDQIAAAQAMKMDPMEYAKHVKSSPGGAR